MKDADKAGLLDDLRERINTDLAALVRRQQDIQQGATHEENRAEHAKDTRATEQSYLARGLAARVDEMRLIADWISNTNAKRFEAGDAIGLMAIVVLRDEQDDETQTWWLVPGAGGIELSQQNRRIRTLSPASPLGRALIGRSVGDEGVFASPAGERSFEILEIA